MSELPPSAVEKFLAANSLPLEAGQLPSDANVALDDTLEDAFRLVDRTKADVASFFRSLHSAQMEDHQEGRQGLIWEIIHPKTPTRFSMCLPRDKSDMTWRSAMCEAVSTVLLNDASRPHCELSLWFECGGFIWAVWPNICFSLGLRVCASIVLKEHWAGYGPNHHSKFDPSFLAHYARSINRIQYTRFPLPTQPYFIGAFDGKGDRFLYDEARHKKSYGHIFYRGLVGFQHTEISNAPYDRLIKFYSAIRLGNCQGCLNEKGYPSTDFLSRQMRDELKRQQARGREVAPPPPPGASLPRLTWNSPQFDFHECVRILTAAVNNAGEDTEYREAFSLLNTWFVKESGNRGQLYYLGKEPNLLFGKNASEDKCALKLLPVCSKELSERLGDVQIDITRNEETGKTASVSIFKQWLKHPDLNVVHRIICHPKPSLELDYNNPYSADFKFFNSWQGWNYYREGHHQRMHAAYGHLSMPELFQVEAIKDILALLYGILCNSDRNTFLAALFLLANVLQRPDKPARKAMIFMGPEGTGKSLLSDAFVNKIFGHQHAVVVTDSNALVGNFNEAGEGMGFIVSEEAFFGGNKEVCARLKQTITSLFMRINHKYGDMRTVVNVATHWMNTNIDFPLPADETARRIFASVVSSLVQYLDAAQKEGYFARVARHLAGDGAYKFAYFLSRINIDQWMQQVPTFILQNDALAKLKLHTMLTENPVHAWLYSCIEARCVGVAISQERETDPKTGNTITKTKEDPIPWNSVQRWDSLYKAFKKHSGFGAGRFVTIENFREKVNEILMDARGYKNMVAGDGKDSGHTCCQLPDEDNAYYAFRLKIPGLEKAHSTHVFREYEHRHKRIKTVANKAQIEAVDLLPGNPADPADQFEKLFGDKNEVKFNPTPFTKPKPPEDKEEDPAPVLRPDVPPDDMSDE